MTLDQLVNLFTWSNAGFYVTITLLSFALLVVVQRGMRRQ